MGRPPKSNRLKILSGSKNARKPPKKPKEKLPMWECPSHVFDHGKELWNRVGPILLHSGIMNELDRGCFEGLCSIYDRLLKFQAILREDGPLVDDKRGAQKKHPISTAISQHGALFKAYCQDFGMTPSSRSRLGFTIDGVEDEDQVWEQFMKKRKEREEERAMDELID